MEFFRLEVLFVLRAGDEGDARFRFGEGEIREDVLFLALGEVPEDDDAVGEDEHLREGEGVGAHSCGAHGPRGPGAFPSFARAVR